MIKTVQGGRDERRNGYNYEALEVMRTMDEIGAQWGLKYPME